MNQPVTTIKIHTTEPAEIVIGRQNVKTVNNKAKIITERSREPIYITVNTDSTQKTVEVSSINSFAYYLNLLYNLGIGMFVDKNNDKRFTYPSNIFIDPADSSDRFHRFVPVIKKGNLYLHISVPYVNHFYFQPSGEPSKSNAGFFGLSAGMDYYYRNNRFVSLKAAKAIDFLVPIPAHVDYSGEHETTSSVYLTLSDHFRMRRFSIGYGLSFSKNTWNFIYHDRFNPPPPTRDPVSKSSYGLGLTLPVQYHIGKKFVIGMNYRPTFFRFSGSIKNTYEHLISLDFGWKLRLND
jgi:hypothetical protein